MGQLTIDTLNKTDRDDAMVSLHAIAIKNGEDLLFRPINDYNDKACKLEELETEMLKCQDDNTKLIEELDNVKKRNDTLFEANKTLSKNIDTYKNRNDELEAEIKVLKEKLSAFIVGYGDDCDNKLKYFKPEEGKLANTIQKDAFYIGASKGEDVFEYQFNEEKGLPQKAILSRNEILIPFCEIVYETPDANYIENKHKGSFSVANGEFEILEKAKIILKKQ